MATSNEITLGLDRAARFGLREPRRGLRYLEARALGELAALLPALPWLMSQPPGDGRRVMVIPGFLFSDGSTWLLRQYLRFLGYDALPWGMGRNGGQPERDAERLLERLICLQRTGERITLVGWSLGGVIARLVARYDPGIVEEVITLGTPVEGGPKYTSAGRVLARKRGIDLDDFERHVHTINSEGVERPLTIIYSRSDGVVHWRAAIDRYNPHANHIRVRGSHIGLGVNPVVWRLIARILGNASPGR